MRYIFIARCIVDARNQLDLNCSFIFQFSFFNNSDTVLLQFLKTRTSNRYHWSGLTTNISRPIPSFQFTLTILLMVKINGKDKLFRYTNNEKRQMERIGGT